MPRDDASVVAGRLGVAALILVGVSIAAVVGVGRALWAYETTPGDPGDTAARWPSAAPLVLAHDAPTLVVMIHPRCPCTDASLAELAEVLAEHPGPRVHVVVRVYRPEDRVSALVERARALPNASVVFDEGELGATFGPLTSGHVLLYAADGALIFSGGITLARGELGDNPGRRALEAAIADAAGPGVAPVFGCPLAGDTDTVGPAENSP